MAQEIVRNVPRRASLLPRRDVVARPPGRMRRMLAAAAVEAAPELIQHKPEPAEPAEPVTEPDISGYTPEPVPFSGTIHVGPLSELLAATTSLVTSGHDMATPIIAVVEDDKVTSLIGLVGPSAAAAAETQDGPQE